MDKRKNQEILEKEIDLIQSCINRMGQNSFLVKGWMISIIAVAIGILPEKLDINILSTMGIIVVLCFWYLDGFFLCTEKLFRLKYEWVIVNRYHNDNYFYDLNPYNKKMWKESDNKTPTTLSAMTSKTILPIYMLTIIFLVILLVYNNI